MRIRDHLLLLTAVVLVPSFVAAGFAVSQVRDRARDASLGALHETVRSTALLVDGQIQRSIGALTSLAQSEHLQTGDFAALYDHAAALDRRPSLWTLVLDRTGTQRINTAVPFGSPAPPPMAKDRVAQVLATRRPLVTDLIVGPATGRLLTTLYLPAKASPVGEFVVAQSFSADYWETLAIRPDGRDKWVVAIIDRNGKFIWRSHGIDRYLGRAARPELVAAAAAAGSGLIRHQTLEGTDSYDAFAHSALTGWTIAVAAPVPTIESSATQAILWLSAGLALALAAALTGATLLGRTLIRSLDAASAAARTLGRGETPRPPKTVVREINALNDALRDAGGLLARTESERRTLLDNERAANAAAQAENMAKDRFLALLGHELRNPLAAIAGAGDVLTRGRPDDETQRRFLAVIQRQNRHLRRIVDDLLEASRMLSGKISLVSQPLDLAACVDSCLESLRVTAQAREFEWAVSAEPVWVSADPVRLEQIVNNLVVNAMQFSSPHGLISVAVSARGDDAVIAVRDRGAGIAPEFMPRLFEPFVQGPPVAGRKSGGLGIGLALVKQLVELHGGRIEVHSDGPGTGAMFEVALPRVAAPRSPSAESQAPDVMPACHVLLVDDEADLRETTACLLRSAGHRVTEASDGRSALSAADIDAPDVVVMDLGLPDMSGRELAARIKAKAALRDIPLIALSGFGQPHDRDASLASGFVEHLVKPAELDLLLRAIETHIGSLAPLWRRRE